LPVTLAQRPFELEQRLFEALHLAVQALDLLAPLRKPALRLHAGLVGTLACMGGFLELSLHAEQTQGQGFELCIGCDRRLPIADNSSARWLQPPSSIKIAGTRGLCRERSRVM
jgi:hypothetical protein